MDRRDRNLQWYSSFNEKKMVVTVSTDEDREIPVRFEVCGTCEGKGTHVHPGVDSHGLTQSDFDEDPDFREDYFHGKYDVVCNECKGRRVVPVPDEERATAEDIKFVNDKIEADGRYEAECEAERRMGA